MSRVKKMFCSGAGTSFRYVMAETKAEATKVFGATARLPDSDDMRRIWFENHLHEKDTEAIQAMFGISRQALSLWRQKAGADVPRYRDHMAQQTRDNIRLALNPSKSAAEIAEELGTTSTLVREIAEQEGVVLPQKHVKKPSDPEIVKLAKGRTWRQLAEACNVTVQTLQHYIYAKPELAKQVKANIVYEDSGSLAHGRMNVDRLIELNSQGRSAYGIAKEMGVQCMTVIYWLKKLGIYRGADTVSTPAVTG